MAVGIGEHTEPMVAMSLGQAELYAVVAASRGNRIVVCGTGAGCRASQRGGGVEEVPETAEGLVCSLPRVDDHKSFAYGGVVNCRILDHVIETPAVPASFE